MEQTYAQWVEENFASVCGLYEITHSYGSWTNYRKSFNQVDNINNLVIHHEWSMGGTYGNCYDDNKSTVEGEIQPEFTDLDIVIELLNPNLTFMQYRRKVIPLIKTTIQSRGDYYGGETSTGIEYIMLKDLWDALDEL
jgi:hypothetical protein